MRALLSSPVTFGVKELFCLHVNRQKQTIYNSLFGILFFFLQLRTCYVLRTGPVRAALFLRLAFWRNGFFIHGQRGNGREFAPSFNSTSMEMTSVLSASLTSRGWKRAGKHRRRNCAHRARRPVAPLSITAITGRVALWIVAWLPTKRATACRV